MNASSPARTLPKLLLALTALVLAGGVLLFYPHSDPIKTKTPAPAVVVSTAAAPPSPPVAASSLPPSPPPTLVTAAPTTTPTSAIQKRLLLSPLERQQKARTANTVARLAQEYALVPLRLKLTPEEAAALHRLIFAREQAGHLTIVSSDQEPGPPPRPDAAALGLMRQNRDDLEAQIKTLLGPDRYTEFKAFEKTIPDRNAIAKLQSRLAPADLLTEQQQADLESAIAALVGPGHGRSLLGRTSAVSDRTVQAATPFLTPAQLAALTRQATEDQATIARAKTGKN